MYKINKKIVIPNKMKHFSISLPQLFYQFHSQIFPHNKKNVEKEKFSYFLFFFLFIVKEIFVVAEA
jgi:hypothetical protein